MPRMFGKLNFKKSRNKYDVASKDVFVIRVELLDSTMLECSLLSSESTGRDCLDNVSQRLGLQQPDLFGLKYVSRRSYPKIRWVDLDRPLKKQLDKYSTEPYLYLGVIFYVTDVSLLEDEVTRYHYFLQLKMDVVEGRLRCNYEQAIVLASYSLQAEFGDHDQEKHTAEYLKDFPLLPKPMVSQFEDRLGALTDAVVTQHASLKGIPQQLSEIYYIVGAQQLDGYGQDCFLAKDDGGKDVLLAPSLIGICVRKGDGQQPQFFKWNEITNLVNHKKYFGIECQQYEFSVQFVFDEPDAAKYVWKMCVLQHTFYKMHQTATENNELNITLSPPTMQDNNFSRPPPGPGGIKHSDIATFQRQSQNIPAKVMTVASSNTPNNDSSSKVEIKAGHSSSKMSNNNLFPGSKPEHSLSGYSNRKAASRARMGSRDREREGVASRTALTGRISRTNLSERGGGRLSVMAGLSSVTVSGQYLQSNTSLSNLSESLSTVMRSTEQLPGARSTTELDQMGLGVVMSPSGHNNTVVPAYRPAPDYETAVMSKYGGGGGVAGVTPQLAQLYSSQPSLHPLHPGPGPTTDLTYLLSSSLAPPGYPLTTSHTYSTPELNTFLDNSQQTRVDLHNKSAAPLSVFSQQRVYSPAPPPYLHPPTTSFSSSTPDLATQAGLVAAGISSGVIGVGGSSPDLVSRRTLGVAALKPGKQAESELHRTYDNLTTAYSTEELNAVYNIKKEQELQSHQSHLLQNIRNAAVSTAVSTDQSYNQSLIESYGGQLFPETLQQLDTHHLSHQEISEPIYQNQGQILAAQQSKVEGEQQLQTATEIQEPIYQNLINLNITRGTEESDSLYIDDTVDGLTLGQGGIPIEREELGVRRGLTTSRENINNISRVSNSPEKQLVYREGQEGRKKIEMRQYLEPAVQPNVKTLDESLINTVNSSSLSLSRVLDSFTSDTMRKQSNCSVVSEDSSAGTQTRSKGRKRWGLNMAVKSGSLKSNKSEKSDGGSKSGEESRQSSGRGMGAMMLANLHGLTRSRPDILSDSVVSAFTAPNKIPRESLGNYLETKLAEGEVVKEFERVPKKKAESNVTIATLAENIPRNRFKDVVPYDENRVKITNDKDNKFGYVNASHISATVGSSQRFYIAAQGPLPNTVHNFWSMVQECDVHLIVMLTEVSGANKPSACIPYWPQNDGSSLEIGDFTITKMFSSESASYTTTTLQLTHIPSRRARRVWHLQYSGWQDHGCPEDVSQYLAFCEEMGALRRHTVSEITAGVNSNTPVLVHCSAGVGRTGVTILADILLYCIDHNIHIDLPKVLTHLRQQRMLMVQTVSQYKFVHTVLIKYLAQSRLI